MSQDTFTERSTWEEYWSKYKPETVKKKNQFQSLLEGMPDGKSTRTFIEVGGFPGTFAIYFKKFKNYKVSLLDYFISKPVIKSLLEKNSLALEELEIIESDFFTYQSAKKYDVVFSSGFIEHFEDTHNVIKKHVDLLADNGTLLITLPNLNGLNGWVQQKFDVKNYDIHNIKCMDLSLLKEICIELDLKEIEVKYYGKPMVWLEHSAPVSKLMKKLIKLLSLSLKVVPFKGSFISPFIYIKAQKT